jgi:adenosyl cobinamide kinase/adenosyl cobinamide phosphate guanylyltransferase
MRTSSDLPLRGSSRSQKSNYDEHLSQEPTHKAREFATPALSDLSP